MARILFAASLLALCCVSIAGAQPLPRAKPAAVGMNAAALAEIDALVAAGIAEKKMPGCVVCVGRRGKIVLLKAYGNKRVLPAEEPMTTDTVFDLASLTKPVATATSVILLVERGELKLDDRVAAILPGFEAEGKGEITIQHLLTHTSGLLPDNALADYDHGSEEAIRRICSLKLQAPTGSKFIYSDVNFILLGEIVRRTSGQSVHEFSQANVFQPLGMRETGYLPPTELRERAAPTEQLDGRWLQGTVHDPRAARLDGIAGHAGLFSTAEDLAIYAQMLLHRGMFGEKRVLKPETIDLMTRDYPVPRGIRGLGWDKQTGYSINKGQKLSAAAFGHGGFTGTVIWIDSQHELFFIFLSNRLHPDGKGAVNPLAGKIADAIVVAIDTTPGAAAPVQPNRRPGRSLTDRYPLPYPPKLPGGQTVVTESSPQFLLPSDKLLKGVEIAKTPPVVDFAYFPEQNYPGNPWSNRADGTVVGDKYYTSSNDHLAPRGTAHLWEYDGAAKTFRLLCDTSRFLESVNAFPPEMNYRPGEMQSRIDLGSDGWLYYATDRGSPTVTNAAHDYRGEWILKTNPATLETKVVATFPIDKHTIPASVLDPKRMILYCGTAPGKDAANQKIQFFVLNVKTGTVLCVVDDGPSRTLAFSLSSGRVYWQGKMYDPETNRVTAADVPHVRSATRETPQGIIYGTSERSADLWALDVNTGKTHQLGSGAVATQEYIASIEADPTGRYLYYVPGAHGGAAGDGTPIVQYDLKTGRRKVLAFLHDHFWDKYGYALDGSFGSALDEKGERLFISWDGWRKGQPRGWESAAITVVHIPAEERMVE